MIGDAPIFTILNEEYFLFTGFLKHLMIGVQT